MIITREQSLSLARKSGVVDKSSSNLNRFAQAAADLRNIEIEQLQAKNAELSAEVERLKDQVTTACYANNQFVEINHELRQQLAIAEAQNARLREALRNLDDYCDPANHTSFCECDPSVGYQCAVCHWPIIQEVAEAREALSLPASRETLDAYVSDRVKALAEIETNLRQQIAHLNDDLAGTKSDVEYVKKQRDLAVSAMEKVADDGGNRLQYEAVVALSAIKESEV